jgi:hypothetical protein
MTPPLPCKRDKHVKKCSFRAACGTGLEEDQDPGERKRSNYKPLPEKCNSLTTSGCSASPPKHLNRNRTRTRTGGYYGWTGQGPSSGFSDIARAALGQIYF